MDSEVRKELNSIKAEIEKLKRDVANLKEEIREKASVYDLFYSAHVELGDCGH